MFQPHAGGDLGAGAYRCVPRPTDERSVRGAQPGPGQIVKSRRCRHANGAALANGGGARSSSADRSFRLPTQPDEMIAVRHDGAGVSRPTRHRRLRVTVCAKSARTAGCPQRFARCVAMWCDAQRRVVERCDAPRRVALPTVMWISPTRLIDCVKGWRGREATSRQCCCRIAFNSIDPDRTSRAILLWRPLSMHSEAFAVSQSDCYPIAKRVQQIVLSFIVLIAYPKTFDLVDQVIARFTLVDCGLIEGVVGVFDVFTVNIAGNREGSLILARGSQFSINGGCWPLPADSLLQQDCSGVFVLDPNTNRTMAGTAEP